MAKPDKPRKSAAPKPLPGADAPDLPTEMVAVADLKKHPRNYKEHQADQVAHIVELMRIGGVFKNIVVARDNTILMGHGVTEAAKLAGRERLPVRRLDVDPDDPRALMLVAGDNEISNLASVDDRRLTEMLKEIMEAGSLLGTGFDDAQLAALAFVTRPASELATTDEAASWLGMPEFSASDPGFKVVVNFETTKQRAEFLKKIGVTIFGRKDGNTWSCWWPPRKEKQDLGALKFVGTKGAKSDRKVLARG
jgi:hypothetical protein